MRAPRQATKPGRGRNRLRYALARLLRNQQGTTAVEFAIVSVPFIGLIMAILETALTFFAGQAMETAVANSARLIRTGQVQQQALTASGFKQLICDQLSLFMTCANIYVDVQRYATFGDISLGLPIDTDGKLKTVGYQYSPGSGSDIVVVRAFYAWPMFFNKWGGNTATLSDGNHLLSSAAAFRNEPFPW